MHHLLLDFFYTNLLHPRSKIHKYETRHSNKIQTNQTGHKFADLCIRNQLPLVINAAPANIIQKLLTHSFGGYSSYVENSFIENYNFDYITFRIMFVQKLILFHFTHFYGLVSS